MMRIPISQESVALALNRALNHYDKAPDFLDSAYIINVQEERGLGRFPLGPSRRGIRERGGI